jgi:peptidoglycan hydrolase-like protein with peptidoglycan-binding domain
MKKLLTTLWAVALAAVWTVGAPGPVAAQDKAEQTKDKVQSTGETAKDKMQSAGETMKDKLQSAGETTKDKLQSAGETAKEKLQSAGETAKEKLVETKDKIKAKMHGSDKGTVKSEADVKAAQQALMDKGYNPGPVDGKMGPKTRAALTSYQKAEGMQATGRLDSDTVAKLGVSSAPSASPPSTEPATPPKPQTQ